MIFVDQKVKKKNLTPEKRWVYFTDNIIHV